MTPKPDGPPPNPNPRKPVLALPPGACDAHCHIYGPFDRFPLPPERSFTPNAAPETALRRLHDHLGIARAVIVQSQGHGLDHRPLLAALTEGAGRYRGVALLKPDCTEGEIAALDAGGICGVRFNFLTHLGGQPDLAAMRTIIAKVAPFGWHVAIHVAGHDIVTQEGFLGSIAAPVVVDHMARPPLAEGPDGPSIVALKRLIDTGRVWLKLSGADRLSVAGPPFHDALPIATSLARHAPERMLWGSDWPHVNLRGPMPDDGDLVDLLTEIAPGSRERQLMLVDNPQTLFNFA
ncbi:amidohydrolase family protein [Bosea psychrotolerans]|uniref:Putative TIM-barrel fold metal-dependent hydrolase n=1 Tax=Bosea psychrotolerans TaxID=1871628 RepID=A0A2S4MQ43_9HYPH|nr:amidohydrolase family protein [Bosea psychrotolerans]POR56880.1 putative TIM-barrel fold metal-dependent hydrolase [Bosea psychrotolerans]